MSDGRDDGGMSERGRLPRRKGDKVEGEGQAECEFEGKGVRAGE